MVASLKSLSQYLAKEKLSNKGYATATQFDLLVRRLEEGPEMIELLSDIQQSIEMGILGHSRPDSPTPSLTNNAAILDRGFSKSPARAGRLGTTNAASNSTLSSP